LLAQKAIALAHRLVDVDDATPGERNDRCGHRRGLEEAGETLEAGLHFARGLGVTGVVVYVVERE